DEVAITLPRKRATQVALNYENLIPEFTMRDNYKTLKGFPSLNRPLEFRLFKDVENPKKTQIFLMPDVSYNLYDGFSVGGRFYNGNLIRKPFRYSIRPNYGLTSKKLVGSVALSYEHPVQDRSERLYEVRYGISANTFSYDDDLLYRRGSLYLNLAYRPKDLRSNAVQNLNIRNILVSRDRNPLNPISEPDYNVFNITYGSSDLNLKRFKSYGGGIEVSQKFTKVDFRTQWRRLYKDNRQLSVRFFAGAFLSNDTQATGNFFSFALDRPTDYLFDYNYYGRSESTGLFSQQFIPAEGGFKSQLEPAFANQWITTTNASYSIWKYVFVYGDLGLVKNKNVDPAFVYDSGVRLNLLQDYFELYFPVYSNNGWEIAQPDYDQKIRFIVTLDLTTMIKLFNRRWY
ncbi:MAG: aminopeptidase, partial [Nonlabens sp.]|nr:aminopeptidase [Nonlabens sp.]